MNFYEMQLNNFVLLTVESVRLLGGDIKKFGNESTLQANVF
jgi:hypothetical protein